jgi:hypothetical protein
MLDEWHLIPSRKKPRKGVKKKNRTYSEAMQFDPFFPEMGDHDGDGVLNAFDCRPYNKNKQDIGSALKAVGRGLVTGGKAAGKGAVRFGKGAYRHAQATGRVMAEDYRRVATPENIERLKRGAKGFARAVSGTEEEIDKQFGLKPTTKAKPVLDRHMYRPLSDSTLRTLRTKLVEALMKSYNKRVIDESQYSKDLARIRVARSARDFVDLFKKRDLRRFTSYVMKLDIPQHDKQELLLAARR